MATNSSWQTLIKVNGQTFSPDDEILFKIGGSWIGTLNPLIDGNGNTDVVILTNQQYWEINPASTDDERRVFTCAR